MSEARMSTEKRAVIGVVSAAGLFLGGLGCRALALDMGIPLFPSGPFASSFSPDSQTGYNDALKRQLDKVVRPEAVKIASIVLADPSSSVRISKDRKHYTVSKLYDEELYTEVDLTFGLADGTPQAENVQDVSLYQGVTGPNGNVAIASLIDLSLTGDGEYADAYASVHETLTNYQAPNTSSLTNMPSVERGTDGAHEAINNARTIVQDTRKNFEPYIH